MEEVCRRCAVGVEEVWRRCAGCALEEQVECRCGGVEKCEEVQQWKCSRVVERARAIPWKRMGILMELYGSRVGGVEGVCRVDAGSLRRVGVT